MKISVKKGMPGKLDKLCRKIVKDRANWTCQKCSHEFPEEYNAKGDRIAVGLDWSHFKGCRLYATRWDLCNSLALCRKCHTHHGHTSWMEFKIRQEFGEYECNRVIALHNNPPKWHKYMFDEKLEELMSYRVSGWRGYGNIFM